MRCDAVNGYYVQYKDSGKPVEVLDRVTYAFQGQDRTCLVQNVNHLAILLKTDRYRVVGVELDGQVVPAPNPTTGNLNDASAEIDADVVTPKPRGRPRKGR